jgi:flagellar protein FliO/FliZ
MWLELLQAFFLFGLVLVLAWLTTRLAGTRMGLTMRGRLVRVLEHVPAGRDRSVMLLEVGGRLYLVGATAEQIRLLDRIEDAAVIERIMAQVPPQDGTPLGAVLPGTFKDLLDKLRGGAPAGAGEAPPAAVTSDEIKRLEQQLERLRRLQEK